MNNIQLIALYTLIRHEIVRMFRISIQSFLPPVISTLLYFLIFGDIIGKRIGSIQGVNYATFIAPGLVLIAVINNAYTNVSASLFSVRFLRNIEEVLVSPMHYSILLFGYVLGGVIRGLIVAVLVVCIAACFINFATIHLFATFLIIGLISALFALTGFMNGLVATNFDNVAFVPTFILSPLTYLGGVFYSITMLPPFWQQIARFNPIVYMVDTLRHAMIGQHESNTVLAISVMCSLLVLLVGINMFMLRKGTGIRE